MMRLRILGSGTSYGVPVIGCGCDVCRSDDPRNRRTRASALIEADGQRLLIDTSTDLRAQALRHGIRTVDAILFTHAHADHLHGIDDVRRFSGVARRAIPAYADAATATDIRLRYAYIFNDHAYRLGWGIPRLELSVIEAPTRVGDVEVTPVPILHGENLILGYRAGAVAYLTDCSGIPETSLPMLEGLDVLVLDALRRKPHPTHFSLSQALEAAERIGARRTFFTHISHDLDHAATEAGLPDNVRLAYDGLEIESG